MTEPIIQAAAMVVIHPGSLFLRIGRASDPFPHQIPHVIARKCKSNAAQKSCDPYLPPPVKLDGLERQNMENCRKHLEVMLEKCPKSDRSTRIATPPEEVFEHNCRVKVQLLDGICEYGWSKSEQAKREYIVGEEVLYLSSKADYNINWPMRRGHLNVHGGTDGSLTSVLANLETIWSVGIKSYLDIPLKDLKHYRAVLVIPDVYNRQHVKVLIDLLLNKLGFSSCFVHLESVCATFGSGVSHALVVDAGDQKVSVSCVEDGIAHPETRLMMEYGGADVSQCFHWLLKKCGFPYRQCDSNNYYDALLLNDLKESMCHMDMDIEGSQEKSFQVKIPGQQVRMYKIHVGDEAIVAPLSLFYPDLLGITGPKRTMTSRRNSGDCEDPFDENYLRETHVSRRVASKDQDATSKENADGMVPLPTEDNAPLVPMDDDIDQVDILGNPGGLREDKDQTLEINHLIGIDIAILTSLERCRVSDDIKKKICGTILIVGGGLIFKSVDSWLYPRLFSQIPYAYRPDQLDIITQPKDMDPRTAVWKGASIMCRLDTAQEFWIKDREWNSLGVRVLREKAPFTW